MFFRIISLIIILLISFCSNSSAQKNDLDARQSRIALIIGNNMYKHQPSLANAENDADSMYSVLKNEFGFKVIIHKNLTKRKTIEVLNQFKDSAKNKDVALIYLSGHGVQDRGHLYFVPTDGQFVDRDNIDYYNCNIQKILDYYESRCDSGRNINILIVDACRNSPYGSKSVQHPTPDISGLSIKDGMLVALSTHSGYFSIDKFDGSNGLFTQELLKQIRVEGPIDKIMKRTRIEVSIKSKKQQVPNVIDNLNIEFQFINQNRMSDNFAKDANLKNKIDSIHTIRTYSLPLFHSGMEVKLNAIDSIQLKEVTIGSQVWMLNNLNVVKYRNGDRIPQAQNIKAMDDCNRQKIGCWSYIYNDSRNKEKLYNIYAVLDARGLAPAGWDIPSLIDLIILRSEVRDSFGTNIKTFSYENFDLLRPQKLSWYQKGDTKNHLGIWAKDKKTIWWSITWVVGDKYFVFEIDRFADINSSPTTNFHSVRCVRK